MINRFVLSALSLVLAFGVFVPTALAADPDVPTIFSPVDGAVVDSLTPTLYAYYSDPDGGDTGFTEYRVSSGSAGDCLADISTVDTGLSSETTTENEVTSYVVGGALTDTATYNWCARNYDGNTNSAWTTMGSFTVYETTTLLAATYLGTSLNDYGESIGILPNGEVVVISRVSSSSFPTTGGVIQPTDPSPATRQHAAISVFDEDLTTLLRSTYVGGSNSDDYLRDGDVDDNGNIYIAGTSYSSDLPQSGILTGFDTTPDTDCGDNFLLKINDSLTSILFSTYIGGTDPVAQGNFEECELMSGGVAVHPTSGVAMIVGNTGAVSFPTTANAFDPVGDGPLDGYYGDLYVSFIDTTQSGNASNLYTSFIGDTSAGEWAYDAFYMDASGYGYIGFEVYDPFSQTTSGAYETTYPNTGTDGVFMKVDPTGTSVTSLVYASFIEGASPYGIFAEDDGFIYVTGPTDAVALATTPGTFDTTPSGSGDCFLYKIDPAGNGAADLVAGSYVPVCQSVVVDPSGFVYFAGETTDMALPTSANAFRSAMIGGASRSGYIGKLTGDLVTLDYGSYFGIQGTNGQAFFPTLTLDGRGSLYMTGSVQPNLVADLTILNGDATTGAYDETQNDGQDIFVARFALPSDPIVPGPVASAPSAIIDLAAIAGSTEVDLTWSAPANGGDAITDYVIQFGETAGFPGNAAVFPDGVSTATTATVTGLTNGTDYSFVVSAVNGVGTAPDSNVATAIPLSTAGGMRGRTSTIGGPQFFLGRVMEYFGEMNDASSSSTGLRGAAEVPGGGQTSQRGVDFPSLMWGAGELQEIQGDDFFGDASQYPNLNASQRASLVKLLDLIIALRKLFHWVYGPQNYELLQPSEVLARQYREMFLTRRFHQLVGVEYVKTQGEQEYDFEYRESLGMPTDIVAFFMRSVMLSFGKSCYSDSVLQQAESYDVDGNPYWYEGYVKVMKPWMDEVVKSRSYQLWRTTGDINVLDAVYLFLYGFCMEQ